ncbi:hypothetical protein [Roseateles sp.]|uniref:hypothetical protein n=1 Tax=Roseateles sp. TaxID=1971397 RepID=UPI0039458A02
MLILQPLPCPDAQALFERLARVAHRHPLVAERAWQRLSAAARARGEVALAVDALVQCFALLEPRGRGAELTTALRAALMDAAALPLQAARVHEALGRIAYQQAEYQQAGLHWREALRGAESRGNAQLRVAAEIGLAQIHYAHGDWAAGLHAHESAARHADAGDSYLQAKLALNLGVGHFELADLPAAERQFSHGLAAARRGAHREFEAEAHWHLAQTALARKDLSFAVADCRLVLGLAARHGYPWLEAAASRTWTEIALARGDTQSAIRSTRHALALAQRIQARAQASQAHRQLAQLLEQEGDLAGALAHLWQHVALQGELARLG